MTCKQLTALVLALLLMPAAAHSATVTIGASKDCSIFQNSVNNSAGGAAGIFAGNNGNGSPRRGLIEFDVAAGVPAGATITGAELTLHLGAAGGGAAQTFGLHRLNADWGEGTAGSLSPMVAGGGNGFAAAAGDATWNANFLSSSLWSNPGGTGDFNASASASSSVGSTVEAPYSWLSTSALVSDVQSWLNAPAANFGWALIHATEVGNGTARGFYSRLATVNAGGDPLDPSFRPALIVTYTIPEPAAGVMLLLVGPMALLFRRR